MAYNLILSTPIKGQIFPAYCEKEENNALYFYTFNDILEKLQILNHRDLLVLLFIYIASTTAYRFTTMTNSGMLRAIYYRFPAVHRRLQSILISC